MNLKSGYHFGDWVTLPDDHCIFKKFAKVQNKRKHKQYTEVNIRNPFLVVGRHGDGYLLYNKSTVSSSGGVSDVEHVFGWDKNTAIKDYDMSPSSTQPGITGSVAAFVLRFLRLRLMTANDHKDRVLQWGTELIKGKIDTKEFLDMLVSWNVNMNVFPADCAFMQELRSKSKKYIDSRLAGGFGEPDPVFIPGDIVYVSAYPYGYPDLAHRKYQVLESSAEHQRDTDYRYYTLKDVETGEVIKQTHGYMGPHLYWIPYRVGDVLMAMDFNCVHHKFDVKIVKIFTKPQHDAAMFKLRFPDGSLKEAYISSRVRTFRLHRAEGRAVEYSFISQAYLDLEKVIPFRHSLEDFNKKLRAEVERRERVEKTEKLAAPVPKFKVGDIYGKTEKSRYHTNAGHDIFHSASFYVMSIDPKMVDYDGLHKGYAKIQTDYQQYDCNYTIQEINKRLDDGRYFKVDFRIDEPVRLDYKGSRKSYTIYGKVKEYRFTELDTLMYKIEPDGIDTRHEYIVLAEQLSRYSEQKFTIQPGTVFDVWMDKEDCKHGEAKRFSLEILSISGMSATCRYTGPTATKEREYSFNEINDILARSERYEKKSKK